MAASNKIAYHARSISLPTESHPLTLAVEEQLCRLRSSELASSSTICHNLAGLKDLYECVEDFLQLESTQQVKSIEGILDGSLMLLDVCGTARDALSQMKQCVQDLQSSIRRRTNDIGAYMISRKKVSKVIRNCLTDLKRMDNKNNDLVAKVSVLREVEATTVAIFESLLSFVSGPKQSSWSLVSKLMPNKRVAHKTEEETTEVVKVDIALNAHISHKPSKVIELKDVQKPLEALEMSLQDLEDGLESVFRCLIKNRVSLLNILNQ
ncbi:Protein of unknown function DUF241 [Macleaya cordata]|uniref:DUF241 domain-containing protein n=1 Tax=Macleaya cordata TaxID=56857 RepID=A0A200QKH1_MACCD|nr:Protein of unknown function DUF241 [Macleaya cordata]